MKRFLRALAYGMASVRLALAVGGVAILYPLTAYPASELFGLEGEAFGTARATVPGTIDPLSGAFSPFSPTNLPIGHYAPVYDPASNAFFVTGEPLTGSAFPNQIIRIDAATGAVTPIDVHVPVAPGVISGLEGVGVNTTNGQLFGLVGEALGALRATVPGTIDPLSGAFSPFGPTNLPIGHYAPVYDPASNAFFVTGEPLTGSAFPNQIIRIDAATGAVTPIDVHVPVAPGVISGLEGVGVNTTNGQLFGLEGEAFGTVRATVPGTIDPLSGAFSPFGPTNLPIGHYAPVYDPASNAFFVTGEPLTGSAFPNQIIRIDTATGAVTPIDVHVPVAPGVISGLEGVGVISSSVATVPEPSTWAIILLGLAGLGVARYRGSCKVLRADT